MCWGRQMRRTYKRNSVVRRSLRIHQTRKHWPESGRWQSGDGKRPSSVSLGRSRARICIRPLTPSEIGNLGHHGIISVV
jgi:hypothetical protein